MALRPDELVVVIGPRTTAVLDVNTVEQVLSHIVDHVVLGASTQTTPSADDISQGRKTNDRLLRFFSTDGEEVELCLETTGHVLSGAHRAADPVAPTRRGGVRRTRDRPSRRRSLLRQHSPPAAGAAATWQLGRTARRAARDGPVPPADRYPRVVPQLLRPRLD